MTAAALAVLGVVAAFAVSRARAPSIDGATAAAVPAHEEAELASPSGVLDVARRATAEREGPRASEAAEAAPPASDAAVESCVTGRVLLAPGIAEAERFAVVAFAPGQELGQAPLEPDGAFSLRVATRGAVALVLRCRWGDVAELGDAVPRPCGGPESVHVDLSDAIQAATVVVRGPDGGELRGAWMVPSARTGPTLPPRRPMTSSTLDVRGSFGDPVPWHTALPLAGVPVLVGAPGHVARELSLTPSDVDIRVEFAPEVRVRLHYGAVPAWLAVREVELRAGAAVLCDAVALDERGEATLRPEVLIPATCAGRAVVTRRNGSSLPTVVGLEASDGRRTFDLAEGAAVLEVAIGERELARLAKLRGE